MADAYRTAAFLCPVCSNAVLREFHGRLVCDECQGMQLPADDFVASIREIDGSQDQVAISDAAAAPGCPQCKEPMTACSLAFGTLHVAGMMRCARHGLWVPRDVMTAAYARASRRGGFRGFGATAGAASRFGGGGMPGDAAASMISNMPSAHGGMSGAMAGIASAFGSGAPASGGLAISHWQHHRPRAHTLFVSAHKDLSLGCPACTTALAYQGDRWACASCHGLFVENEALVAMVREMTLGLWDLPPVAGTRGERACPICETPMAVELLEGVTIDRCDVHGVWFDDHELEQALHHAATPQHGLGVWLRRLFGR